MEHINIKNNLNSFSTQTRSCLPADAAAQFIPLKRGIYMFLSDKSFAV